MSKNTLTPGVLPGDNPGAQIAEVHASLDDVVQFVAASVRGESAADMHAELVDITDAGMIGRSAPQWLGELWDGVTYERQIVPLLTKGNLTSRKAIGYKWKTKPGVEKYSGNKTEIPSKPAAIETVEREAQRWAGGNDIDRAFWDFGETEFLAAYWRAMAESYAFETDQDAGLFLVENATATGAAAPNLITAVARGAISIQQKLRTKATFTLINPNDFESILTLSELDAPKYLAKVGMPDPTNWVASEFVEEGSVIMGTKTAVTHYELSGSPLRVEAEHIARGGRDAALFGYTALMLNKPEGLVKFNFGATAGE